MFCFIVIAVIQTLEVRSHCERRRRAIVVSAAHVWPARRELGGSPKHQMMQSALRCKNYETKWTHHHAPLNQPCSRARAALCIPLLA